MFARLFGKQAHLSAIYSLLLAPIKHMDMKPKPLAEKWFLCRKAGWNDEIKAFEAHMAGLKFESKHGVYPDRVEFLREAK